MVSHRFRPEIQPIEEDFSEISVVNCERKDLFVTPFWDFELDINNDEIVDECFGLQKRFPKGVQKSNWGGGWQSQVYELETINRNTTPKIQNLARNIVDICNDLLEEYESPKRCSDDNIGWWININRGMGYNVHHTHPGCSLIGIYYPMIPKNLKDREGMFAIIRTDATNHNAAFADIENNAEYFIRPKEKHLYIMPSTVAHYVTPHFDQSERISIAFNIE